ncbi:hypothetical protein EDD37DRAFT_645225 [Exophiala viscosa]|uniref:Uncharacterized protein n=1 Tax=Exophiala viscosa TaxID=2486360 RepID=A0AAN6IH80_9EURO|nr:hypothetical protein EDD36DRAFT_461835 [Exophiala viscosa]KAI1629468.1 hypothetical protein EDD37DRAFT_645225 [Exophiala viscosa]
MAGFNTMISALAAVMLLVQQKADDCLFLLNLKLTSLTHFFRETLTLPAPPPVTQYVTKIVHKTHTATPTTVTTILAPATTLEYITAPTMTGPYREFPEEVQFHSFVDTSPLRWLLLGYFVFTFLFVLLTCALWLRQHKRRQLRMKAGRKSRKGNQELVLSIPTMLIRTLFAIRLLFSFIGHVIFSSEPDYEFIPLTNILIETKMSLWTKFKTALGKLYAVIAPPISRFVSRIVTFSISALHCICAVIAIIAPGVMAFSISSYRCLHGAFFWLSQASREYVLEPFGEHVWPTLCTSVVCFLRDYLWWFAQDCAGPVLADAFIAPIQMAFQKPTLKTRQTRSHSRMPTDAGTSSLNSFTPNLMATPAQPNNFQVPYTPGSGTLQTPNPQHLSPVNHQLHLRVEQENKSLRQDVHSLKKKLEREQAKREDAELRAKNEQEINDKVHSGLIDIQEKQQRLEARYASVAVKKPEPVITHFKSPGEDSKPVTEKPVTIIRKHTQGHKPRSERLRTVRPLHPRVSIFRKSAELFRKSVEQRTARNAKLVRIHKKHMLELLASQDVTPAQNTAQGVTPDGNTAQGVTPDENTALLGLENTIQQQSLKLQRSSDTLRDYQTALEGQVSRINELTTSTQGKDRQITELIQQAGNLQSQINELTTSTQGKDRQIAEINQHVGNLQSQVNELTTSTQNKDRHIAELNQHVGNRDIEIDRQRQVIQQQNANINSMTVNGVNQEGARVREAQVALEEERTRSQRLEQARNEQESALAQLRQNANDGNARIQQLETETATLRAQTAMNGVLQATTEDHRRRNEGLRQELDQVRGELDDAYLTISGLGGGNDETNTLLNDSDAVVVTGGAGAYQPVNEYSATEIEEYDPAALIAAGVLDGVVGFNSTAAGPSAPRPPPSPPASIPGLGFAEDGESLPKFPKRILKKPKSRLRRPEGLNPPTVFSAGGGARVNPFAGLAAGGGPTVNPSPMNVPNLAYAAANAAPAPGTVPAAAPVQPGVPAGFTSTALGQVAALSVEQLHQLAMNAPARAARQASEDGQVSSEENQDDADFDAAFDRAYEELDAEESAVREYSTDDARDEESE